MSRVHIICTNLEILAGGKIDVSQKGWSGAVWTNIPGKTTYDAVSRFGYGPACAEICPTGALAYLDINEAMENKQKRFGRTLA